MPTNVKPWYSFYRGALRVKRKPVTFTPFMNGTTEPLTGRGLRHDLVLHPELWSHPWKFNGKSRWVISDRESGCTVTDGGWATPLLALRNWHAKVRRVTRKERRPIGATLGEHRTAWWQDQIRLCQSCRTDLPPLSWPESTFLFQVALTCRPTPLENVPC